MHAVACLWGLGGLIWIKLLLRTAQAHQYDSMESRYSATVI
ncbi:MAG: hypothetical protein ACLU0O_00740 [Collinsella sp.]